MWRKIRLSIALIVAAFSLGYATFDYLGWLDKITGREVALSGLSRLSSTKGYPEIIVFNDEKEFKPLLKFILANTKDQQTLNLKKEGQIPTAIVRLGGTLTVPGAEAPTIDYDPRRKSRGSGNRNKGLILSPFLSRASVLRRGSEKLSMTQNNFLFLIQQKMRFLKN